MATLAAVPLLVDTILTNGSYLGIILFLVLTGCGLPAPEEVPIVMAGILSSQGQLHTGLAFASCLVGAVLGDCVMYAMGYHFGHNLLRNHPRFARFLRADREAKFEHMIQSHGLKVLFVARFMVGVRSPVYLSAGILRVSFRRFLLTDLVSATLVVSLFFGLAYFFGNTIMNAMRGAEVWFTLAALSVLVVGGLIYAWRVWRTVPATAPPGGEKLDQDAPEGDGDAVLAGDEKHVA
jgi:membrane protein DedA with SNARE-associated domain